MIIRDPFVTAGTRKTKDIGIETGIVIWCDGMLDAEEEQRIEINCVLWPKMVIYY